jgi:olfactory receptor
MGLVGATAHTVCMLRLVFCKANIINHCFCDLYPVLELSCSSTFINDIVGLCLCAFNIHSTEGRSKAFSTCRSHIAAVVLFYGSTAFMYLQPSSLNSMDQGKVSSVFYTIIIPMLNLLIYSLRNKDVKVALSKLLVKKSILVWQKKKNYNFYAAHETLCLKS